MARCGSSRSRTVELEGLLLEEALIVVQHCDPPQEGVEVAVVPALNGRFVGGFSDDPVLAPKKMEVVHPRASHREMVSGETQLPRCVVIEELFQCEDGRQS